MTLWRRVVGGVALCSSVVFAVVIAELLVRSELLVLQSAGGDVGALAYIFGLVIFFLGLVIIVVGVIGHLSSAWQRRKTNA